MTIRCIKVVNNEMIILEEEVLDISASQGTEDDMETQYPKNDVVPLEYHNNAKLSEPAPATVVSRRKWESDNKTNSVCTHGRVF